MCLGVLWWVRGTFTGRFVWLSRLGLRPSDLLPNLRSFGPFGPQTYRTFPFRRGMRGLAPCISIALLQCIRADEGSCMPGPEAVLLQMDLSLRSPASPASPASPDVASPAPGAKFIWHSDAHVDPFYLTDRCCVERDLELLDLSAQPLGFMGCNPPISLVSQAFRASAAHDASFVLYTGDFARHEINKVVGMPDSLTVVPLTAKQIL